MTRCPKSAVMSCGKEFLYLGDRGHQQLSLTGRRSRSAAVLLLGKISKTFFKAKKEWGKPTRLLG